MSLRYQGNLGRKCSNRPANNRKVKGGGYREVTVLKGWKKFVDQTQLKLDKLLKPAVEMFGAARVIDASRRNAAFPREQPYQPQNPGANYEHEIPGPLQSQATAAGVRELEMK